MSATKISIAISFSINVANDDSTTDSVNNAARTDISASSCLSNPTSSSDDSSSRAPPNLFENDSNSTDSTSTSSTEREELKAECISTIPSTTTESSFIPTNGGQRSRPRPRARPNPHPATSEEEESDNGGARGRGRGRRRGRGRGRGRKGGKDQRYPTIPPWYKERMDQMQNGDRQNDADRHSNASSTPTAAIFMQNNAKYSASSWVYSFLFDSSPFYHS